MPRSIALTLFLLLSVQFVFAQDKLVINDRSSILNGELEAGIKGKLQEDNISYTNMVDFSKRCEYYFAVLQISADDLMLRVNDCDDKMLGEKNLGKRIRSAPVSEQGLLISYALLDIISEPGVYVPAKPTASALKSDPESLPKNDSAYADEHASRYFFAPSAYTLKKGEGYYNTIYFLIHDVQYGLTDNFSLGMGTTVIGLPLYLTPKYSIPIGERSAFAVGDLLMLGTWGTNFIGNLVYGAFSNGGRNGNFTLGAGYLYTNENDITGETSSLVSNFSAMTRISPRVFLLTENYIMSANFNRYASYYDNSDPNYYEYIEEEFVQRNTFWYGIVGVRIVTKSKDYISWSAGLTYLVNFPGEIPDQYKSWDTNATTEIRMIAFPTVGFALKFGNR